MLKKKPNQKPKNLQKQLKGQQGEQLAKKLLLSKGYSFLIQNYRTKIGEIDLVFREKDELVFVEVKTRTRFEQGSPEEAVTPHKLRTIERVAQWFMQDQGLEDNLARIDVVAIELVGNNTTIRHHKNVTG